MNIIRSYDMTVVVGSYKKDGETKKVYRKIGRLVETDTGPVIWLDRAFNPAAIPSGVGDGSILVSCYPKENNESGRYGPSSKEQF